METPTPSAEVVARVRRVMEDAAADAVQAGRAEVAVGRIADLTDHADYDCPVVLLTPRKSDAARVIVEVQEDDLWWVNVADGPGSELHAEVEQDRYELLGSMIRSVIAGRYRHGSCTRDVPRLLRSPRRIEGWCETFELEGEPFTSEHFGRAAPEQERRFAPY